MTPKQTALTNVALMLFTAVAGGFALGALLALFGPAQVGLGAALVVLAYIVKMMYDMEVDRVERLQRLNETR